jgi:DNA-binding response OmpR family regulator
LGADSFVVVPFDRRELVARAEALVRRYRQAFLPLLAR